MTCETMDLDPSSRRNQFLGTDSKESKERPGVTDTTQLFIDLVRVETRLYNSADARLRATHA